MSNGTSAHSRVPWLETVQPLYGAYRGPERRSGVVPIGRWLAASLDEIDYGVLLLRDTTTVAHANHSARAELQGDHPLQLAGSTLRVRYPRDAAALRDAIAAATGRGMRRMLTLGLVPRQLTVSVVPVTTHGADEQPAALVVLEKRQVCEQLAVQGFARCHGLTSAETAVLQALCDGLNPMEIAQQNGVAVCTVRSQVGSVRAKTGARSIRELLSRIAALPPLRMARSKGPRSFSAS
ncbi:MAG TPA: LuxR C-terminal-related transcriptional regulator [Burkholderiales bacterium]|nr:LuxR C-terminal-related transcriptional regulator [Burkholderiales bacterium]